MLSIRLNMWATIGYLKYKFSVDALKQVMLNMGKIGQLPKGYMYPELHASTKMNKDLWRTLLRK